MQNITNSDRNELEFPTGRKIIYSRRIAIALREQGFKILETQVNKSNPKFDCYIFEATPEFYEALDKLI